MGISFDAPLALLLLPALLAVVIALHLASRRRLGVGRRRAALAVRVAAALGRSSSRSPGSSSCCRWTGWRWSSSWTCPTRSAPPGARRRSRSCARRSRRRTDEDVAGIVAFGGDALVERLPSDLAEIDRIASTPVKSRDRHRAPRCAWPPRSSRTTPRSGSCCSRTATTRPATARPRPRWRPPAGSRSRRSSSGSAAATRSLVERLTAPSTARLGESIDGHGRHHLHRRPAGDGPALRRRRARRVDRP